MPDELDVDVQEMVEAAYELRIVRGSGCVYAHLYDRDDGKFVASFAGDDRQEALHRAGRFVLAHEHHNAALESLRQENAALRKRLEGAQAKVTELSMAARDASLQQELLSRPSKKKTK